MQRRRQPRKGKQPKPAEPPKPTGWWVHSYDVLGPGSIAVVGAFAPFIFRPTYTGPAKGTPWKKNPVTV